jgi:hypothetical protein
MSLTGVPLFACAVLATAAALAATILVWNRGPRLRLRYPLRSFGVLLTEALLVASVGLVINRSEQFYPDWAALRQSGNATGTTYAVRPGGLDGWLRDHASDLGDVFPWQPAGWTDWHLAGAPLVVTPAGYLKHAGWRYPALLVLDDGRTGWTTDAETTAARSADSAAGPAIVVFARTTKATSTESLTAAIPAALAHDLRVTDRHWALVAPAADTELADRTVAAAPDRYPALALVRAAATSRKPPTTGTKKPATTKPAVKKPAAKKPAARPTVPAKTTLAHLPVGVTTTTVVVTAPTGRTTNPPGTAGENALAAALDWACRQTPPPLAASTPAARSLPVYHSHHHAKRPAPSRSGAPGVVRPSAGVPKPRGGQRVAG